jgi:hypothetical protein
MVGAFFYNGSCWNGRNWPMSYVVSVQPDEKTKQQHTLWTAALKGIGNRLKRELEPEQDTPDRLRQLIAELEAKTASKNELDK